MPMSEPEVNDQLAETDKAESALQEQQQQPSTVTTVILMHLLYRLHPLSSEDHQESRRLKSDWTFSLTKATEVVVFS